jgi:hypothetical protein
VFSPGVAGRLPVVVPPGRDPGRHWPTQPVGSLPSAIVPPPPAAGTAFADGVRGIGFSAFDTAETVVARVAICSVLLVPVLAFAALVFVVVVPAVVEFALVLGAAASPWPGWVLLPAAPLTVLGLGVLLVVLIVESGATVGSAGGSWFPVAVAACRVAERFDAPSVPEVWIRLAEVASVCRAGLPPVPAPPAPFAPPPALAGPLLLAGAFGAVGRPAGLTGRLVSEPGTDVVAAPARAVPARTGPVGPFALGSVPPPVLAEAAALLV